DDQRVAFAARVHRQGAGDHAAVVATRKPVAARLTLVTGEAFLPGVRAERVLVHRVLHRMRGVARLAAGALSGWIRRDHRERELVTARAVGGTAEIGEGLGVVRRRGRLVAREHPALADVTDGAGHALGGERPAAALHLRELLGEGRVAVHAPVERSIAVFALADLVGPGESVPALRPVGVHAGMAADAGGRAQLVRRARV